MEDDLRSKLNERKPVIRSILLSLGKHATEKFFRLEYYNIEGESFQKLLNEFHVSFYQFMRSIPDVCRVWKVPGKEGEEIHIERVSTEKSKHMDNLTIVTKTRKKSKPCPMRYRSNFNRRPRNSIHAPRRQPLNSSRHNSVFKSPIAAASRRKSSVHSRLQPQSPRRNPQVNRSVNLLPLMHQNKTTVAFKPDAKKVKENKKENIESKSPSTVAAPALNFRIANGWGFGTTLWNPPITRAPESPFMVQPLQQKPVEKVPVNPFLEYMEFLLKVNKFNDNDVDMAIGKLAEVEPKVEIKKSPASSITTKPFKSLAKCHPKEVKVITENNFDIKNYIAGKEVCLSPVVREVTAMFSFVIEIIDFASPSQFIFQFNQSILQTMQDKMNRHYKSLEECKHLRIRQLTPDMFVAAHDEGNWHRVKVLCISVSDAFVYFVDEGSRKNIKTDKLRYLEKTFVMPSRKACRGCLVGVKPQKGETLWNDGAKLKFINATIGKKLFAVITGENCGVYQCALFFDSTKVKKVSDYLILQGLADKDPSVNLSMHAILV